ncbi:MAG TPA: transglutaminaseTgpA domain-containing protein [Thermodesulfovibrionia bacterium]|nr:transglutaminaseTgpA domain-containing protein [Thermodesulfovibrionia bacterium]
MERFLSILVVILSAKLLSPKKARDLLQIYLLNFLLVAASAVVRWGIDFGFLLLVETLISVAGLIFIYGSYEHQDIPKPQAWQLFRWSVMITIALIPVTFF